MLFVVIVGDKIGNRDGIATIEGVVDLDSEYDFGFRVSATARVRALYGSVVNHLCNFKFRRHNVWFSRKF